MIKKVKDWLGIEGVKIELDIPETFSLRSGRLSGFYKITSLSEQEVERVNLTLKEKYSRGRRKSKLIDEFIIGKASYDIGQVVDKERFIIKEFELNFKSVKSPVDKFGDKNPLFKGISSIAKILKNAKSKYFLVIEATVTGNKLKPYDKVELVVQ